ncbi:MAG: hypothetical protein ABI333_09905 [bacterium]
MPYCPECGSDALATDAFCEGCGASLIRGQRQPLSRSPSAAEPGAAAEPSGQIESAYPALRMGRLRRRGQRSRPNVRADAPKERTAPVALENDLEPATILSRPDFDDVREPEPPPSTGQRYVSEELEHEREEPRRPKPPAPFEDPPHTAPRRHRTAPMDAFADEPLAPPAREPTPPRKPRVTGYDALAPRDVEREHSLRVTNRPEISQKKDATRRRDEWGTADESRQVQRPQDVSDTRKRLSERFAGLDLDIEDSATEPPGKRRMDRGRLTSPRRTDVRTKGIAAEYEEDAVLSELAKHYSREYTGREGWNPGAFSDSIAYTFRVVGRTAGRSMAVRRLRKDREARERVRLDQLSELGEVALSLRNLDTPLLDDYRSRLLELHHEQEMREDEVDSLNQQVEESRRSFAQTERHNHALRDQLGTQTKGAEDKLRPVEADYRAALKKARAAEDDARALGRQIDHARGELSSLTNKEGAGDEAARLKPKIERWTSERDGLLREVPRLNELAAGLEPEIERLRKDLDRHKQQEREHRETVLNQEAEHKREVQRLEAEVERIRVAIEKISGQRRTLFQECGRQLDIDRPDHDHLEEIYGELDATATEMRRIDHEIEIAQAKPVPLDYGALARAGVALCGCIFVLSLILYALS